MPVEEERLTTEQVHDRVLSEAHTIFARLLAARTTFGPVVFRGGVTGSCPEIVLESETVSPLATALLQEVTADSETGFAVELYGGRLRIVTAAWPTGLPF